MHYVGYKGLITRRTCREDILQPIWLIKASRWFSDDDDDVQGIPPLSIFSKDLIHIFIVYSMIYRCLFKWCYSNLFLLSMFILHDITCWAICAHSCLTFQLKMKLLKAHAKIREKPRWTDTLLFYVTVYFIFRNLCLMKRSVLYAKTLDVCLL